MTTRRKRRGRWPHENLLTWQKARALAARVYASTRELPRDERFGLQSQMRRAAVSVVSNIAEGASRATDRDFLRFLSIARGSLSELAAQVDICSDLAFLSTSAADELHYTIDNVSYFLHQLMESLKTKIQRSPGEQLRTP